MASNSQRQPRDSDKPKLKLRSLSSAILDTISSIQDTIDPNIGIMSTSANGTKHVTLVSGVTGTISPGGTKDFTDSDGVRGVVSPGGTQKGNQDSNIIIDSQSQASSSTTYSSTSFVDPQTIIPAIVKPKTSRANKDLNFKKNLASGSNSNSDVNHDSDKNLTSSLISKGKDNPSAIEKRATRSSVASASSSATQPPVKKLNYTFKEFIDPILAKPCEQWFPLAQAAKKNLPRGSDVKLFVTELQAATYERAKAEAAMAKDVKNGAPIDPEVNPWFPWFRIMVVATVLEAYPEYINNLKAQAKKLTTGGEYKEALSFYEEVGGDPKEVLKGLTVLMEEDEKEKEEAEAEGGQVEGRWTLKESVAMMEWCFEHHHEMLCRLYPEYGHLPVLAEVAREMEG